MRIVYIDNYLKPTKSTEGSMCYDLKSSESITIMPGEVKIVPLGFKTDFGWKMYGRSSLPKKGLMFIIGVGIIDSDYRGEILACLYNFSKESVVINYGDRLTQAEFPEGVEFIEDELLFDGWDIKTPTARGVGGYGSTGI